MAEPYGWSQDAVDGALYALVAGGFLGARLNGVNVPAKQIPQNQVGPAEFHSIGNPLNALHRIAMRGLATDVGISVKTGEEEASVRPILDRLLAQAARAGGPAPAAATPLTQEIQDLVTLANEEQFIAVAGKRQDLAGKYRVWCAREAAIAERLPRWEQLQRLHKHASALPVAPQIQGQVDAILANRMLLADPDPVTPLAQQLTETLSAAVTSARTALVDERDARMAALESSDDWQKLGETDRAAILANAGLGPVAAANVSNPAALLGALDATPLDDWSEKLAALPARIARAREMAAKQLQPTAVRVHAKAATLKNAAEVEAYLVGLRAEIMSHIDAGNPVIL